MDRRDFLKSSLATGLLYAAGGLPVPGHSVARAAGFPVLSQRVVVNLMLFGGPDFRHLFPPPYEPDPRSYGYLHWENKAAAHAIDRHARAYESRWLNDYFHVSDGGTEFGILNSCGWLKRMWDAGNVAIVCNAVGGQDRDHAHCQLQMDQGDLTSGHDDKERSGWGGRLAAAANGNVLALTRAPRRFCYGPDPDDPLSHDNSNLITARDTRSMSLYRPPDSFSVTSKYHVTSRNLESYYEAKRAEMGSTSVFRRFIDHESSVRTFGDPVNARLASVPLPESVSGLIQGGLSDPYLGRQIRNLHDCFLSSDILQMRVASMEYGSWDSHADQKALIEPKFQDLFGDGKALDVLYQVLPAHVTDNMVLVIAGEFGRQIRANGDDGSDHGKGTNMLLIGNGVRGGVYGDMFPPAELDRLGDSSPDITGLTEIDHIFGAACDWALPGGGDIVFPNRSAAALEPNVNPNRLFV